MLELEELLHKITHKDVYALQHNEYDRNIILTEACLSTL